MADSDSTLLPPASTPSPRANSDVATNTSAALPRTTSAGSVDDDEPLCRICRCEGDASDPLFHPCRCDGSVALVHSSCLQSWLSYSKKNACELCKYKYKFVPEYAPGTPSRLPNSLLLRAGAVWLLRKLPTVLHVGVAAVVWGVVMPIFAAWCYRVWVHLPSLMHTPLWPRLTSPPLLFNDWLCGAALVAFLCACVLTNVGVGELMLFELAAIARRHTRAGERWTAAQRQAREQRDARAQREAAVQQALQETVTRALSPDAGAAYARLLAAREAFHGNAGWMVALGASYGGALLLWLPPQPEFGNVVARGFNHASLCVLSAFLLQQLYMYCMRRRAGAVKPVHEALAPVHAVYERAAATQMKRSTFTVMTLGATAAVVALVLLAAGGAVADEWKLGAERPTDLSCVRGYIAHLMGVVCTILQLPTAAPSSATHWFQTELLGASLCLLVQLAVVLTLDAHSVTLSTLQDYAMVTASLNNRLDRLQNLMARIGSAAPAATSAAIFASATPPSASLTLHSRFTSAIDAVEARCVRAGVPDDVAVVYSTLICPLTLVVALLLLGNVGADAFSFAPGYSRTRTALQAIVGVSVCVAYAVGVVKAVGRATESHGLLQPELRAHAPARHLRRVAVRHALINARKTAHSALNVSAVGAYIVLSICAVLDPRTVTHVARMVEPTLPLRLAMKENIVRSIASAHGVNVVDYLEYAWRVDRELVPLWLEAHQVHAPPSNASDAVDAEVPTEAAYNFSTLQHVNTTERQPNAAPGSMDAVRASLLHVRPLTNVDTIAHAYLYDAMLALTSVFLALSVALFVFPADPPLHDAQRAYDAYAEQWRTELQQHMTGQRDGAAGTVALVEQHAPRQAADAEPPVAGGNGVAAAVNDAARAAVAAADDNGDALWDAVRQEAEDGDGEAGAFPLLEITGLNGNVLTVVLHAGIAMILMTIGMGLYVAMPILSGRSSVVFLRTRRVWSFLWDFSVFTWPHYPSPQDLVIQESDVLHLVRGYAFIGIVLMLLAIGNECVRSMLASCVRVRALWHEPLTPPKPSQQALRLWDASLYALLGQDAGCFLDGYVALTDIKGPLDHMQQSRTAAMLGRIISLVLLRIGLLPLAAGWMLDYASLPLFDANMDLRLAYARHHVVASVLMHWMLGLSTLVIITAVIIQTRESLAYEVMARWRPAIRQRQRLFRNLMDTPVLRHFREVATACVITACCILVFIRAPCEAIAHHGFRINGRAPLVMRAQTHLHGVYVPSSPLFVEYRYGASSLDGLKLSTLWQGATDALHDVKTMLGGNMTAAREAFKRQPANVSESDHAGSHGGIVSLAAEDLLREQLRMASADTAMGTLTLLSITCALPQVDVPAMTAVPPSAAGEQRNDTFHALGLTCDPPRVLALKLYVHLAMSSRRSTAFSDIVSFAAPALLEDDSTRAFRLGGTSAIAASHITQGAVHSGVAESVNDTADAAGSTVQPDVEKSSPPTSLQRLARIAALSISILMDTVLMTFDHTLPENVGMLATDLAHLMHDWIPSLFDDPAWADSPQRPASIPDSDAQNASTVHHGRPDVEPGSAVFHSADAHPFFNVTVFEGTREYDMLAPTFVRALHLQRLLRSNDSGSDFSSIPSNTTECTVDADTTAMLPHGHALHGLAVWCIPVFRRGAMQANFSTKSNPEVQDAPLSNFTDVPMMNESIVRADGTSDVQVSVNGSDDTTSSDNTTCSVSDDIPASVVAPPSDEPVTWDYDVLLLRMPVVKLESISTLGHDVHASTVLAHSMCLLSWRLAYAGYVQLKTQDSASTDMSDVMRVNVNGSSFQRWSTIASRVAALLPPTSPRRIDDWSLWAVNVSQSRAAVHDAVRAQSWPPSGFASLFLTRSTTNNASDLPVDVLNITASSNATVGASRAASGEDDDADAAVGTLVGGVKYARVQSRDAAAVPGSHVRVGMVVRTGTYAGLRVCMHTGRSSREFLASLGRGDHLGHASRAHTLMRASNTSDKSTAVEGRSTSTADASNGTLVADERVFRSYHLDSAGHVMDCGETTAPAHTLASLMPPPAAALLRLQSYPSDAVFSHAWPHNDTLHVPAWVYTAPEAQVRDGFPSIHVTLSSAFEADTPTWLRWLLRYVIVLLWCATSLAALVRGVALGIAGLLARNVLPAHVHISYSNVHWHFLLDVVLAYGCIMLTLEVAKAFAWMVQVVWMDALANVCGLRNAVLPPLERLKFVAAYVSSSGRGMRMCDAGLIPEQADVEYAIHRHMDGTPSVGLRSRMQANTVQVDGMQLQRQQVEVRQQLEARLQPAAPVGSATTVTLNTPQAGTRQRPRSSASSGRPVVPLGLLPLPMHPHRLGSLDVPALTLALSRARTHAQVYAACERAVARAVHARDAAAAAMDPDDVSRMNDEAFLTFRALLDGDGVQAHASLYAVKRHVMSWLHHVQRMQADAEAASNALAHVCDVSTPLPSPLRSLHSQQQSGATPASAYHHDADNDDEDEDDDAASASSGSSEEGDAPAAHNTETTQEDDASVQRLRLAINSPAASLLRENAPMMAVVSASTLARPSVPTPKRGTTSKACTVHADALDLQLQRMLMVETVCARVSPLVLRRARLAYLGAHLHAQAAAAQHDGSQQRAHEHLSMDLLTDQDVIAGINLNVIARRTFLRHAAPAVGTTATRAGPRELSLAELKQLPRVLPVIHGEPLPPYLMQARTLPFLHMIALEEDVYKRAPSHVVMEPFDAPMCAVCGASRDETCDMGWGTAPMGDVTVCSTACAHAAAQGIASPAPPVHHTYVTLTLQAARPAPASTQVTRTAAAPPPATATRMLLHGFVWILDMSSRMFLRVPLFMLASVAIISCLTVTALSVGLFLGRLALACAHIETHDAYALPTGMYLLFFLCDIACVTGYACVNTCVGMARRIAVRVHSLALYVSLAAAKRSSLRVDVPTRPDTSVVASSGAQQPASLTDVVCTHAPIFTAARWHACSAITSSVQRTLTRAWLWCTIRLWRVAMVSMLETGNVVHIPHTMTRTRARAALSMCLALLVVCPFALGALLTALRDPLTTARALMTPVHMHTHALQVQQAMMHTNGTLLYALPYCAAGTAAGPESTVAHAVPLHALLHTAVHPRACVGGTTSVLHMLAMLWVGGACVMYAAHMCATIGLCGARAHEVVDMFEWRVMAVMSTRWWSQRVRPATLLVLSATAAVCSTLTPVLVCALALMNRLLHRVDSADLTLLHEELDGVWVHAVYSSNSDLATRVAMLRSTTHALLRALTVLIVAALLAGVAVFATRDGSRRNACTRQLDAWRDELRKEQFQVGQRLQNFPEHRRRRNRVARAAAAAMH